MGDFDTMDKRGSSLFFCALCTCPSVAVPSLFFFMKVVCVASHFECSHNNGQKSRVFISCYLKQRARFASEERARKRHRRQKKEKNERKKVSVCVLDEERGDIRILFRGSRQNFEQESEGALEMNKKG